MYQEKLQRLADQHDYVNIDEMLEMACMDGVAPAICIEPGCNHTGYMEPDGDGECPKCKKGPTVKSCLLLAGII